MFRIALLVALVLVVVTSTATSAADRWNEPAAFGYVPLSSTEPDAMVRPYVNWQSEMWFEGGTARLEEVSWMPDCKGTVPPEKDLFEGETAFEIVDVPGVQQTIFLLHSIPGIKFTSTVREAVIPIKIVERRNGHVTRTWTRKFLVHFFFAPRQGPFRPFNTLALLQ